MLIALPVPNQYETAHPVIMRWAVPRLWAASGLAATTQKHLLGNLTSRFLGGNRQRQSSDERA